MNLTGDYYLLLYALSNVFKYSKLLDKRFNRTEGKIMTINRVVHIVAGTFILASLGLAHYVSPKWLWFTAFVGANLLQSGFTNWCLMSIILKKAGLKESPAS